MNKFKKRGSHFIYDDENDSANTANYGRCSTANYGSGSTANYGSGSTANYGDNDNFHKIKNIVDQFSSVKKYHLKDKKLNEKLEKKEYYDDFFSLKYREYYKEDLINLCLETLLKNTNYILNNYKQYKNCSIFFLLLFYNIFLPYTTNDIFVYFKCIQRNYIFYKKKNLQHYFEHILKNIELSDFNHHFVNNIINSKNLSHTIIPYLNILQHDNNFLDKAIFLNDHKKEIHQMENYQYAGKDINIGEEQEEDETKHNCLNEYEMFINSYDLNYKMRKIKIENIVPLNLLYKFFQLVNFNINNVQLVFLLNEVIKESTLRERIDDEGVDSTGDVDNVDSEDSADSVDSNALKFKRTQNSPYQFRNLFCPLLQIKNKTLIVHKNSKKLYFKNLNIIDQHFNTSQGLIIQIFDNPIYNLISIYANVYIVAYKVDILIERSK
ncbi:hypothetical protein PMALA_032200 [Plasmodium malariae]|uniref:Uncharacterized protein n=1 Tax=Plasmodium malariae TaxID=5858 RepID=A0A1A8WIY7_PLAMA|nr:hypothetical protein PMALA_032200 [Plasmodium malariae]